MKKMLFLVAFAATSIVSFADGYTRGDMITQSNTLVSGRKYIVFCSNSESPAKSGYWTTSSSGTNLIMTQHPDDAEFSDAFVWTFEKKGTSYWELTNLATGTKIKQAASSTDYCAAELGSGTAADFSIGNAGKGTGTWKFNHYPSFYMGYTATYLYTSSTTNYGVSESEGVALAYKTGGSGTTQCYMMIYPAEQVITNPLQIKLNDLIKTIVADNNPNELQAALTKARAVEDATLQDVEDLLAPYLIYKGQNIAKLQKPNAEDPDAYGSVYMPFSMVLPTGVSAYVATPDEDVLQLTKVGEGGNSIPAGAYILWSTTVSGEVTMAKSVTEAPSLEVENVLTGTIVDDITLPEGSNYVLSKGSSGIGFYKYTPSTYPACRAVYTAGSASSASRFLFSFDDVVTALQPTPVNSAGTPAIFDLQGRKRGSLHNGLNIIDGCKTIIR